MSRKFTSYKECIETMFQVNMDTNFKAESLKYNRKKKSTNMLNNYNPVKLGCYAATTLHPAL